MPWSLNPSKPINETIEFFRLNAGEQAAKALQEKLQGATMIEGTERPMFVVGDSALKDPGVWSTFARDCSQASCL
jgi:hypothetical protein